MKRFCSATSISAGRVIDPVLVRLQANLGIKRNMYGAMHRRILFELYFGQSKFDAMLSKFAEIALVSCFSGSNGTWSELNWFLLFLFKTSVCGRKGQSSVLRKSGLFNQWLSERACAESPRVPASLESQTFERSSNLSLSSTPKILPLTWLQTLVNYRWAAATEGR